MLTKTETKLRTTLVNYAQKKSIVPYAKGVYEAGVPINVMKIQDRKQLSDCLLHIAQEDVAAGRPPVTAVMVKDADKLPGKGFFGMTDILGLRKPGEDNFSLYARLLNEVYSYDWSSL